MPQFYLPKIVKTGDLFSLAGPEAVHISKVLRCREGETLELFDGRGRRYKGTILKVTKETVDGRITEAVATDGAADKIQLNLYAAMLKGQHWEWLLEKATEIGVTCFIPVATKRTVVVLKDEDRVGAKLDHWRKIILASAKQCGRADLPDLRPPLSFGEAVAEAGKNGPILLAWEDVADSSKRAPLRRSIEKVYGGKKPPFVVNLFIGPEGGFSADEVEAAKSSGATIIGLGPRILRGDTAAITAVCLILYELGLV